MWWTSQHLFLYHCPSDYLSREINPFRPQDSETPSMTTPREVHKYQLLSGEAPAYGIHDNPSPFTMTCLGIDGYTIQSWPRNSKRKSVGDERGLPGNVFSLLERTPRQRRPFSLLRLGVIPWINPLISTIPPCGENRDDICKSLGHSIHSTHCSYYYFYYSNEVILQKSKFSVIHALK